MAQSSKPDFGVLGLAVFFFIVGMQGLRWLQSAPPSASSTRYGMVIAQLVFGFGIAMGMVILTLSRYLRR